jgi:hypothetical protein
MRAGRLEITGDNAAGRRNATKDGHTRGKWGSENMVALWVIPYYCGGVIGNSDGSAEGDEAMVERFRLLPRAK